MPAIVLGYLAIQDPLFGLLAWDDLGGSMGCWNSSIGCNHI